MNAKIIQAKDLREKERTLARDVPLDMPYALYLEPTSFCNLACAFCPTGDNVLRKQRPNGYMTRETLARVIASLKEFPRPLKRINLYKDGESLLHREFPLLVATLKEAGVADSLWLKTNGVLLDPARNAQLAACGLDWIGISVNALSTEAYKVYTKARVDYERLIEKVADLYSRLPDEMTLYVKLADMGYDPDLIARFYADFGDYCDYIAVEQLHGWAESEVKDFTLATQPTTFEGFPRTDKIVCPLPFYLLAVNWDGTISTCNEDWRHQNLVGDVNDESLKKIWEGARLRAFRLAHLEGRRSDLVMCAQCDYLKTLPDNLDSERERIAKLL